MNCMFNVYYHFSEPGDQYLGRLLAGLDPNNASFALIQPHFVEGMENKEDKGNENKDKKNEDSNNWLLWLIVVGVIILILLGRMKWKPKKK